MENVKSVIKEEECKDNPVFQSIEEILIHPLCSQRLKQSIQAILEGNRTPGAPLQRPTYVCMSEIEANPWHDTKKYEWVKELDDKYMMIKEEYINLYNGQNDLKLDRIHSNVTEGGEWKTFYFYNQGRKIEENCKRFSVSFIFEWLTKYRCPVTTQLIESNPLIMKSNGLMYAYFSILSPGTRITRHCGPANIKLRCHVPLIVPKCKESGIEPSIKTAQNRQGYCEMRVGREVRPWIEGKTVVFDDSFEHEVWNLSDESRVVLLFDIWHPDLTPFEKHAFQYIFK